jgi:hypothetical protein
VGEPLIAELFGVSKAGAEAVCFVGYMWYRPCTPLDLFLSHMQSKLKKLSIALMHAAGNPRVGGGVCCSNKLSGPTMGCELAYDKVKCVPTVIRSKFSPLLLLVLFLHMY